MIKNIARALFGIILISTLPVYAREKKKKQHYPLTTLKNNAQARIKKNQEERSAYRADMMRSGRSKKLKRAFEIEEYHKRRDGFRTMNNEQLIALKQEVLEHDDLEMAIKVAERQLAISTDYAQIRDLRLEIADLNFNFGLYEKAEKLYEEFLMLYPSAIQSEYAHNRSICAASMQLNYFECDQESAKRALRKAEEFCDKGVYAGHMSNVQSVRDECKAIMLRNELAVLHFNIQRNNLKGAQLRLSHIEQEYAPVAHECVINLKPLRDYIDAWSRGDQDTMHIMHKKVHLILNGRNELGDDLLIIRNALNRGNYTKAEKHVGYIETACSVLAEQCHVDTHLLRTYINACKKHDTKVIRELQDAVKTLLYARHQEPRAHFKGPRSLRWSPKTVFASKRVERKAHERLAGRKKPGTKSSKKTYI